MSARRIFGRAIALALAPAALAFAAFAQTYPTKSVRVVVPGLGGAQDVLTRAMAPELTRRWGQPVVVENRTGATGIIAAETVARSAPDGHTILMSSNIQLSLDLLPENRGLSVDPMRDLAPAIALASTGTILVTRPEFPGNTLRELIGVARQKPGALNYGSWGVGSSPHVDTETIAALSGVRVTHVPYKAGGPVLQALLAGDIAFALLGVQPALPVIRQGRLKPIAFGGLQRSPVLPDVPTIAESGFPGLDTGGWFGWLVPAGTARAVIDRIAADAGAVISNPEFRDKYIVGVGMELLNLPPAPFAERLKTFREIYAARVKAVAAKPF